jgi:uncharacterized membrane-anchored protein YhcB (DUF1043 family)
VEESNIWIIGVVALAIGGLIGFLIGRSDGDSNEKEKLEDVKQELESYKTQVAGHFEETADLVNKMTESYRGVYQHLATGAQALCDADTARSIESSMTPQLNAQKEIEVEGAEEANPDKDIANEAETVAVTEPPRDYAPKQPDEEGTLSESYGLKDTDETSSDNNVEHSTEETAKKA